MTESDAKQLEALPCIWVLAGVLSYRLCDRNYDCEGCELFHALQGGRPQTRGFGNAREVGGAQPTSSSELESRVSSYICYLSAGCELHLDRPYSPSHFWLRHAHGEHVFVGIDSHLLRLLYPVDDVTLPHVGVLVKRGEICGWITRGRLAIPLHAPLSGMVEEVNEPYLDRVRATGGAEGSDLWLLNLAAGEDIDTVPDLYRGEAALAWHLKKVQLVKRYLRDAVTTDVDDRVGPTLEDGGAPNLDVEAVMGREPFEALVVDLFNIQI